MKTANFMSLLLVLGGFAALATPGAFDSPNTEHFPRPTSKEAVAVVTEQVRFNGMFTLPYSLRCAGKRLLPGRYTISLRSDGTAGRATLTQKDQTLEVLGVVRPPVDARARSAVLVECIGKARRLAAIHLEKIELVFDVDRQVKPMPQGKAKRTERLLLTRTSVQN